MSIHKYMYIALAQSHVGLDITFVHLFCFSFLLSIFTHFALTLLGGGSFLVASRVDSTKGARLCIF